MVGAEEVTPYAEVLRASASLEKLHKDPAPALDEYEEISGGTRLMDPSAQEPVSRVCRVPPAREGISKAMGRNQPA